MNLKLFLIVLVLSSSLVSVLARDRFVNRNKRGFSIFDSSPTEQDKCPEAKPECPVCLIEPDQNLINTLCDQELVAEVMLSGDPECGQMDVLKDIKFENFGDDSRYKVSIGKSCDQCVKLFDKNVTLITLYSTFSYMVDGFSLGKESHILLGQSSQKICSNSRRSILSEPTFDFSSSTTLPTVDTTPNPLTMTPTPEPFTVPATFQPPYKSDIGWHNKLDDPNLTEEKGRRNISDPAQSLPEQAAPETSVVTSGDDSSAGTDPSAVSNGHSLRSAQSPTYGSPQPNGIYEYPHTQTEYNSPVYSPYSKPPGYLNTGYFTAQSLQYGAGNPPAINPTYYYLGKNEPYNGPKYQPSRLNPKPLYYPIMTLNYGTPSTQSYRPQPISYGQTYQPVQAYSAPLPLSYSNGYSQPLPLPSPPPLVSPPLPQYNSSVYKPNGYSQPISNYTSASYPIQSPLPQYSYGSQPSIPTYGPLPLAPSYGIQSLTYGSAPVVYNSSGPNVYNKRPVNMTLPYTSAPNYNSYNLSANQNYQQSYTTPSYGIQPSVPSYGSQPSAPSYASQPSSPFYGSKPPVSSYGAQPSISSYVPQVSASFAPKQVMPSSYRSSPVPTYSNYQSSNYSQPQSYSSDTFVSGTYSNGYTSGQSLPSYGRSLSQPYASGYSAVQSYSSVYSSPNDYFASSSDRESVVIPDSCPKCIEDVAEPDLIDSLCYFTQIFVASINVTDGQQYVQNVIRDKEMLLGINSTLSNFIRSDCECRQLEDSSVILLTRSQSWKVTEPNDSDKQTQSRYLLLNDSTLVLKYSELHSEDIERMLRDKSCQ